ncbi:SDR family NAD(P)-dependent oxidoreductase [Anabaena cylindrica FACHB-243]|uniref:Phenolphthiocerol/phthiocerol polyketide synthase subunit E n=1 Tax=Anabaena cylindrica (strain ATCC 27899 / PCC 7122) TaxID=272123 RepID=K9ZNK8_ANACC|nr:MULTISPECIES: type I polyketide synthase [Anabaena]AFZ60776.1 6-deoxyerythronolide-B synthase [Anabaena cylindrica PCC 7122]MBD2417076.1 SDR family NAD(P)-dependent oxidoreductase [Anabaena cylindrica FACHB-243]MBY5280772.1 SDR family NAD(P)-dependent oxidoreductase [Anabaena sp. CCAP 1446/1C]MBY5307048.1 SDR family NAD(P)-dependent oxidoreductase [Anabaena sp. CCAP 1446/1C]MCM2406776.1 SDR family NAD(P)-dependent oxidoreductase [Anabaena sp. CCAP 1446/1C]
MNFQHNGLEIAIIGMSGRFPGCNNIDEFWENLKAGVELTSVFTNTKLAKTDTEQKIKAGGILSDVELFDAAFFGFNPREAEAIDPQHRLFLECAWEALENAGYNSQLETRPIGVYAGVGMGTYLLYNLSPNQGWIESKGFLQTLVGVDKDYLASRVSYKLNLTGPSVSIGTACSSSLVAIHLACQSLLSGECDMALGAGVAVKVPQNELTLSPDEIVAADGHCKAFDSRANGTVGGNGIGVVVLKRLEDAIADRDRIYAVIKGSAINNDGAGKVGYTAPSQEGQTRVIRTAQMMAEVEPETITYIEAHGTGTALGDPIEIAAMTQAFRATTDEKNYCAIGSVKTNVGHLDAAAGIVGLIKTVLALDHKLIPPSINFESPNPQIDFDNSPFYVNTKLLEWKTNDSPRRAGVSSFGFGGTNAHIILEEAPPLEISSSARQQHLLVLSAKTSSALATATKNLAAYLKQHPDLNLADVAYTLQIGRQNFNYRRMVVGENLEDVVKKLDFVDQELLTSSNRSVVFMFTGQGSQYVNMGKELYEQETIFREECDRCFDYLQHHLHIDLHSYLYPTETDIQTATQQLQQTAITQPALFVIEYALAKLWISWGVSPVAMIGHSIGEYVAACIAGVFSLEDALSLVVTRGKMMQQLPAGAMLSISLPAQKVQSFLGDNLSLAASNAPLLSVVSGSIADITELEQQLTAKSIEYRRLHTSHAFHSSMMAAVVEPFTLAVKKIKLHPPQIPFISNLTGTWMTPEAATDPNYWARHLRQGVRFAEGIAQLLQNAESIFLEIGPGRTLTTLTKQQASARVILSSLRHPQEKQSDVGFLLNTLGKLWLTGVQINWAGFYQHEKRHRLPLPAYPFERQRYWIDPPQQGNHHSQRLKLDNWFYLPSWQRSIIPTQNLATANVSWLVFVDNTGFGDAFCQRLKTHYQHKVIQVKIGNCFSQINEQVYTINPQIREDYEKLFQKISQLGKVPLIAHLWSLNPHESFEKSQELGLYSLLNLSYVIAKQKITESLKIGVISSDIQIVIGDENIHPEKATVLGGCKVIPQEQPNITCRSIDIVISKLGENELIDKLIVEIVADTSEDVIAYRNNYRWVQTFAAIPLEKTATTKQLRQKGVYLIVGGLGGLGLGIAEYLAKTAQAKLALIGRSTLPEKSAWENWLMTHDEQDISSQKIRKLQEIEKLGAEVLVLSADVADEVQMRSAVTQINAKFGAIHGVIHAAGVRGGGLAQLKTSAMIKAVFAPKVQGTLVLDTIFKDVPLDFLVFWSSIAAFTGGYGNVDYVAAHTFLDRFAQCSSLPTITINWNAWQEAGMAIQLQEKYKLQQSHLEILKNGITLEEGIEAFNRILVSGLSQVIVTPQNMQETMTQYANMGVIFADKLADKTTVKANYPRPHLSNSYVLPRNQIEQTIADIWQEVIGIEKVGIYDNFFDLGGDSLIGVRVINSIQEEFHIQLSTVSIFEAPTVSQLAQLLNPEEKEQFALQQRRSRGEMRRQKMQIQK